MAEVVEVEASLLITPEQVEEAVALVPQVHQVGQVPRWGPVGILLSKVPVKGILLVVVEPKAAQVTVAVMPAQESVPSTEAVVAAAAI
jgi:hypothetical protein